MPALHISNPVTTLPPQSSVLQTPQTGCILPVFLASILPGFMLVPKFIRQEEASSSLANWAPHHTNRGTLAPNPSGRCLHKKGACRWAAGPWL